MLGMRNRKKTKESKGKERKEKDGVVDDDEDGALVSAFVGGEAAYVSTQSVSRVHSTRDGNLRWRWRCRCRCRFARGATNQPNVR